jgi:RHS repeat-associated protein
LSRALACGLIIVLLSTSTPAAPRVIVGTVSEWRVDLIFWLEESGLAARVRGFVWGGGSPATGAQEGQDERDGQVSRLQIFPGDVTIRAGERVVFAAVAYDAQDAPVSGVQFTWSGRDVQRNRPVHVSRRGDFAPKGTGTYTVTAEGAGQQAQVTVRVLEGEKRRKKDEKPSKTRAVSTRDLPQQASAPTKKENGERSSAHAAPSRLAKAAKATLAAAAAPAAALLPCDNCGWDGYNYTSADDPGNTTGDTPGGAQDDGAGSGNFQLAAPVLSLPGRGVDLSLSLAYNSRLWNKSNSEMTYDIDRGWPAPGWSLGFGKILGMGVDNGSLLIDADGTRHGYSGTVTYAYDYSYTDFVGHTTDGTFIDYSHHTGLGGAMTSAYALFPNGTAIEYYVPGAGAMYPSRITDAQGNYITITYVNNTGPNIQTITDTLGRVIRFYYDANNLLTAITAPDVAGTTPRTLVRLHYKRMTLGYGFAAGITPRVRDSAPWLIDAVYYPATDTGYWFGDADSYSSYGMIARVREQRGMNLTTPTAGSLTEQGTVTQGTESSESAYNYTLTANYALTDAPTYTTKTDTWAGMDTAAAVTKYAVQQNASPRTVTITVPNGAKNIQYSYNAPGQFNDGLVYQDETYGPGDTLPVQKSTATWEQGAYESPRPARTEMTNRVEQTATTLTKATEFDYGPVYNQVTEVRDYDYGGLTKLKVTRTQYENSASYTSYRHIFNLVKQVEVFAANGTTRESRTEYTYDGGTLKDAPGVRQHNDASNPYDPQYLVPGECYVDCDPDGYPCYEYCEPDTYISDYNPVTDYRGNVTQVKTYAEAATLAGPLTETRSYDITGNMVTASTSCCEQTSYAYTSATQYAYPTSLTRGSATDATQQVTVSNTYSFGTGLVLTAKDANGRITSKSYFSGSLRPQKVTLPTGAFTQYDYDDSAMTLTETTYLSGGTVIANKNVKHLDGLGVVSREEALTNEGGIDYWDVVDTTYTNMGQVWKQSLPYRSGGVPQWSENFYDELGRVTQIKAPDGSLSKAYYNEEKRPATASPTAGQTTRLVDAWGRERWGRADAQGRLVEVVEPDPQGNGLVIDSPSGVLASTASLVTKYGYDTLGNLTLVTQGSQTRKFDYDSFGRLTRQKLAEASATLDDSGVYKGVGTGGKWSDAFAYDGRSNLTSRTDARGVKTLFTYNNDPLNRLQSVSYDTTGVGAAEQAVAPAPSVTYTYMTTGDRTRLDKVTTTGVSTENYDYDTEGRLSVFTLTLTSRAAYPMATSYIYDTLHRITDVRYPAQYGQATNPRKLVHHDYDVVSRLSGLTYDGATYASAIKYNPTSQTTALKVGAAANASDQLTESYTYDLKTGLLTDQTVVRGAGTATPKTLLNLNYSYLRTGTTTGRTGQLTKITDRLNTNKSRAYEYDTLGRLERASGGAASTVATAPQWTQDYTYDRYGNRTNVVSAGTAIDGATPMQRDGLGAMSYSATTNRVVGYSYDSAGNETRAKRADGAWQRYEYDAAGRLVTVRDDTGLVLVTYTYGSGNQRLIEQNGPDSTYGRTYYAWSGGAVVAEYAEAASTPTPDTTPVWTKSYVYLGNRLLATVQPNGTQYHHPDRLGTRLITNASDTNVIEQVTLPYGTALTSESSDPQAIAGTTTRRFTSYERNETTKLDYAINRHYDSGQGRFTQVDPIGMKAVSLDNPQTLNLYAYCGNDPVNRTDPDGLFWGWLKKLFKAIGKLFSAVAHAVAKVLNNRWVRIGVFIASFLVPFLGPVLQKVIQTALNIYNRIADIVSQLQLAGQLLTGKFKELGISLGLGYVGSFIATIENGIIEGLQHAIGKVTVNGENFIDWKKFSFKKFFSGLWSGLKTGLKDAVHQLWRSEPGKSFWKTLKDSVLPGYGHYCGPGIGVGAGDTRDPVDGVDAGCRTHDRHYNSPDDKLAADLDLFHDLLVAVPRLHLTDIAFGGRPSIGSTFKFTALPLFGAILPAYRGITGNR